MSYEHDIRGLFRLRVDQLPLSEQLPHYHQRDLTSSHLYRLGNDLFGKREIKVRRRLIDSSRYSPPPVQLHTALPKRSLDGRSVVNSCEPGVKADYDSLHLKSSLPIDDNPGVKMHLGHLSVVDNREIRYKKWIDERRRMRTSLNCLSEYKQWLLTKGRTPIESMMLSKMKSEENIESHKRSVVKYDEDGPKSQPIGSKNQHKKHLLKEIAFLEQQCVICRNRLVQLLLLADKGCSKCISVNAMLSIFDKLKIPLSQATREFLLDILDIDGDGVLNYNQLFGGKLLRRAEDYLKQFDYKIAQMPFVEDSCNGFVPTEFQLEESNALSSMSGKNGKLAHRYMEEEEKQFSLLIDYCKENGVLLDRRLAEKALLSPPDHTIKECMLGLRKTDADLLSRHFADPPCIESGKAEKRIVNHAGWGQPYKELRGRGKARHVRLSTGKVKVQSRTDCWLTFSDYLKLTEQIRSRPGFTYKNHQLPDHTAFWPGVMLDKLRLWKPTETVQDKPYSYCNIFQPVHHPKFYNPGLLSLEQKMSWPDSNGYVQFGSYTRKQYHL